MHSPRNCQEISQNFDSLAPGPQRAAHGAGSSKTLRKSLSCCACQYHTRGDMTTRVAVFVALLSKVRSIKQQGEVSEHELLHGRILTKRAHIIRWTALCALLKSLRALQHVGLHKVATWVVAGLVITGDGDAVASLQCSSRQQWHAVIRRSAGSSARAPG